VFSLAIVFPDHCKQPNGKRPPDSIGATGGLGDEGGGDNQSGKSSLVNTADLSEEDAEDQLTAASGGRDKREASGGGLAPAIVNGDAVGNGLSHDPVERGVNGEQESPPSGPTTAGEVEQSGKGSSIGMGLTPPPNTETERYPADLFDVLEAWILEYLRDKLHCGFLLSSHFQEYTRFLHVQQRPVTENDFILFRILGRGGFGAVNGTSSPTPNHHVGEKCARFAVYATFLGTCGMGTFVSSMLDLASSCNTLQDVSAGRPGSCLQ